MQNEVTVMNNELPQLRQMVLENTRRIINNEQMIDELRKRETEEDQKRRERDEFWESVNRDHARARQEHDRDMRELRQMFKESREEFDKSKVEFDRRMVESREKFDRQMAESNRSLEELKKQVKETSEQVKETTKEVKMLSRQFNGETGHIVEGLVSSSADKLFQKFGLDLHNSGKNLRRHLKSENMKMEVDVMLGNDEVVVPIEVKTRFKKEDLYWFLHQMEMFRKLFPEHADKKVIAAIAAIDYDMDVDTLAHKEGLLVIRVNSDDIFSLDPFDMEELKRF